MDPYCELDSCILCGFIFLDKPNIVEEFTKIFGAVIGVEIARKKVRVL